MTELHLEPPSSAVFDEDACAMPHEYAMRALMFEQDMERARLRAIITELEEIITRAGLVPFKSSGESARDAYLQRGETIRAVMTYFGCDGYSLKGIPPELHEAFRPLLVT